MKCVVGHQIQKRIHFIGPFGVGKTTALASVSDIPVAKMDVHSHEALTLCGSDKTTTTVGFDYGEWQMQDEVVGLYGLPGQVRFDAVWDKLLPESTGVVMWLYGDRPDAAEQCAYWLDVLAKRDALRSLVVAVTRVEANEAEPTLDVLRSLVKPHHPYAPVMTADPRNKMSVIQAIAVAVSTPYATSERQKSANHEQQHHLA